MPESLRAHAKRVNDRSTDHEAMRNGKNGTGFDEHLVHPSGDALCHVGERFAAMGRRARIAQPVRGRGRLIGFHVVKRASGPAAEIAIAQQRFDGGGERKPVRGLVGA